jgi:hypothetical protein
MVKVGRPLGLIRYASLDELEGKPVKPMLARPRVWVYAAILLAAISGILYGLTSLAPIELKVLHERAPLFATLSDGSIQNKYTLKILNKDNSDLEVKISASGPEKMTIMGVDDLLLAKHGAVVPAVIYVKVPRKQLEGRAGGHHLPHRGYPPGRPGNLHRTAEHSSLAPSAKPVSGPLCFFEEISHDDPCNLAKYQAPACLEEPLDHWVGLPGRGGPDRQYHFRRPGFLYESGSGG